MSKHAGFTETEASLVEDFSLYNGISFIVRTGGIPRAHICTIRRSWHEQVHVKIVCPKTLPVLHVCRLPLTAKAGQGLHSMLATHGQALMRLC